MYAFGEIVLVAGGAYTSKPRPVLVFQKTDYCTGESLIVIPFTTANNPEIESRIKVEPTPLNNLRQKCFLEIDKISAINVSYIGKSIGQLEEDVLSSVKNTARDLLML